MQNFTDNPCRALDILNISIIHVNGKVFFIETSKVKNGKNYLSRANHLMVLQVWRAVVLEGGGYNIKIGEFLSHT